MNRKFKFSVIFLLVFLMVGTMLFGCVKKEEPQVSKETEAGNESKEPADKYPEHNIDIVIPSAEGGAIDRTVRAVTNVWRKHLGVNFETGFYPGASGEVGYKFFVDKPSDGYTLLAGNIGPEVLVYAMQKPDYKFPEDYVYFATMDADPVVIWVRKDSPYKTIQDLVEAAKEKPLKISTSRYPHPATLAALLLGKETGAQFNIIPYGGGSATRTAGLVGEVDAVTSHLSSSLDISSEIRFLVLFDKENLWKGISDNAPTPKEAFGFDLPPLGANRAWAVKREFIEKYPQRYELLVNTFEKTMNDPALQEELKSAGLDPQFVQYLKEEDSMKLADDMLKLAEEYGSLLQEKEK